MNACDVDVYLDEAIPIDLDLGYFFASVAVCWCEKQVCGEGGEPQHYPHPTQVPHPLGLRGGEREG